MEEVLQATVTDVLRLSGCCWLNCCMCVDGVEQQPVTSIKHARRGCSSLVTVELDFSFKGTGSLPGSQPCKS